VVNEIRRRSTERIRFVVVVAILFAGVIFVTVAMEGYLTFGDRVRGDILLNYPKTGMTTFLRVVIAVMLTLHYPLQLDPSRRCLLSLIGVVAEWLRQLRSMRRDVVDDETSREVSAHSYSEISTIKPSQEPNGYAGVAITLSKEQPSKPNKTTSYLTSDGSDVAFYTITISFLLLSFSIAMIVDDLGIILAVVGATGSTLVSYVLPGLIYVRVQREFCLAKIMAYIQLVLGCIIMPVSLYFVLRG